MSQINITVKLYYRTSSNAAEIKISLPQTLFNFELEESERQFYNFPQPLYSLILRNLSFLLFVQVTLRNNNRIYRMQREMERARIYYRRVIPVHQLFQDPN